MTEEMERDHEAQPESANLNIPRPEGIAAFARSLFPDQFDYPDELMDEEGGNE